jgi:uncharacterized protein YjbI with pentapeptide repeats
MLPDFVTLPLAALLIPAVVLLALMLDRILLPKDASGLSPFRQLMQALGVKNWNIVLFALLACFWLTLFGLLFAGLIGLVYSVFNAPLPTSDTVTEWRFTLAKLVATTGVFGVVVAFPFTIIRLRLMHQQTETAAAALINDKVNAAVDDLHAQRQISKWDDDEKTYTDIWEDDITRRNGAIDRLKGLVAEEPALLDRVDRMLSVYVRELSREYPPKKPEGDTPEALKKWARKLKPVRSDMEYAVQALAALTRPAFQTGGRRLPDLAGANLQGFNMAGLDLGNADLRAAKLQGADLGQAKLQGAYLGQAKLQGAFLGWAKLQGAYLEGAELQGAYLGQAELQGAFLGGAKLQGAYLGGAEFDADTSLVAANFRGAALRAVDFTNIPEITPHIEFVFGDDTVILPPDIPVPERFSVHYETHEDYITAWRAFQHKIGQDPDDPE